MFKNFQNSIQLTVQIQDTLLRFVYHLSNSDHTRKSCCKDMSYYQLCYHHQCYFYHMVLFADV